jgi:hypothetical protein
MLMKISFPMNDNFVISDFPGIADIVDQCYGVGVAIHRQPASLS